VLPTCTTASSAERSVPPPSPSRRTEMTPARARLYPPWTTRVVMDDDVDASATADESEREPIVNRHARSSSIPGASRGLALPPALDSMQKPAGLPIGIASASCTRRGRRLGTRSAQQHGAVTGKTRPASRRGAPARAPSARTAPPSRRGSPRLRDISSAPAAPASLCDGRTSREGPNGVGREGLSSDAPVAALYLLDDDPGD
jgi:hypothetical protein